MATDNNNPNINNNKNKNDNNNKLILSDGQPFLNNIFA